MESSLAEIKSLLLHGQMQATSAANVEAEARPNAELARVRELASEVPAQPRDESPQLQIDITGASSQAIEKVRAAPVNIVRDMKHHILGTNHEAKLASDAQSDDLVELGILSLSLRDCLLQR
jgi:hypothetical protein